MTETNDVFVVRGLNFSCQLGIGSMKWLMKRRGKGLNAVLQELQEMSSAEPDLELMSDLVTAMRLQALYQAHELVDPAQAELEVNGLSFDEVNTILNRGKPLEFDEKNSATPPEVNPEAILTSVPSSTT